MRLNEHLRSTYPGSTAEASQQTGGKGNVSVDEIVSIRPNAQVSAWHTRESESSPFANLNPKRCVLMRKEYDFSKGKRGPVVTEKGKTRITIFLDDEIIRRFRALAQRTGKGYQTLINQALKQQLAIEEPRLTATVVRKIIREELSQV